VNNQRTTGTQPEQTNERNNMRTSHQRSLWAALLALMMLLAACGGTDAADTTAVAEEDAPLALETTTTVAAPTTVAEEAPATTATEVAFDLVAAVDARVSTIPEGWMAVGDITAFKDAMTAGDPVVIDVREESEYAEGHIPGAVNIPIRTLAQSTNLIPTDQQVWIYCASGWRAGMATSSLRMMGYDNVSAFPPGWAGWTEAGEAVETTANEAADFGDPGLNTDMVAAVDGFLSTVPEGFLVVKTIDEVKDAVDNGGVQLVDVREGAEYTEGYILDAMNTSVRTLANAADVPADTPIIVYCQSGWRASLSTAVLGVLGYDVRGFPGSFNAWVEAGEAVTT